MASKMKQPNGQAGATMGSALVGSYSPPGGTFGLSPPVVSPRDGRKKRKDALSWDKYTCTPYFDGYLWRKYGQKNIKNSPFPRLYFRCSYYEDKHCMASKLIQQVSNDYPPLYKVTYMHEHTCNAAPIPAPNVVAEAELPAVSDGFVLISFGSHGKDYSDGRIKQEKRQHHQPMSWSPSELSFDSWSSQLQHQPVLSSDVPPPAAGLSLSFPIAESLPTLPAVRVICCRPAGIRSDIVSKWTIYNSTITWILPGTCFPGTQTWTLTCAVGHVRGLKERRYFCNWNQLSRAVLERGGGSLSAFSKCVP